MISLKCHLASQVKEEHISWRNLIVLIWFPFITWLKTIIPLRWIPLSFAYLASPIWRAAISSSSHYFPLGHLFQLELAYSWLQRQTLDLDLAKKINWSVSKLIRLIFRDVKKKLSAGVSKLKENNPGTVTSHLWHLISQLRGKSRGKTMEEDRCLMS